MLAFLLSAAQSINNSVPTHGSSGRPLVYKRIGIQEEGNPSRDIPIKKPLGAGSFMRCRVLHLNPMERNTHLAIPVSFVCEYVLSLSCNVFGNYGNCLLQIVYFQTQKIPKEKNQLKALKNQVSERERAEKVHIASALFLLSLSNVFIGAEKCLLYFCSLKTQNLPPSPR